MTLISASVLMNRLQAKARVRHLQLLVMLGELRSLKRASEAIGLSQPAATQLLADLEALFETRLFDRHARGVQPTLAGRELLPVAQRILASLADGSEAVVAIQRQGEGSLRIAAIAGAIAGLLVRVVPAFSQAHPHIQLSIVETGATDWGMMLTRKEVDIAACREPAVPLAGYRFMPVMGDRFVIACDPKHPLLRRKSVNWHTLGRETWLPSPVGSAARVTLDRLLSENGAIPRFSPVVTRVSSLTWAMLRHHRLLTLVPYGVVQQLVEAGELAILEPPEPLFFTSVGFVVPSEALSAAASQFTEFVLAHAAKNVVG